MYLQPQRVKEQAHVSKKHISEGGVVVYIDLALNRRVAGDCGRKFWREDGVIAICWEEGCARSFRPRYQRRGEIKKALAAIKVASNPAARVAKCDYKLLFTTRSRAIGRRKDDGSSGREADNMSREFELQKVARYGVNMADVLVLYKHRLPSIPLPTPA